MERPRGAPLALPQNTRPGTGLPARPVQPVDAPRLRRKLQKVAKPRNPTAAKPSAGFLDGTRPNGPREIKGSRGPSNMSTKVQVKPSSRPLPPDLSDAKWLEYVRRSGYHCTPNSSAQSKDAPGIPQIPRNIIPEFSHLLLRDVVKPPRGSLGRHAHHVHHTHHTHHAPPPYRDHPRQRRYRGTSPSSSTESMMRRYAKTPVFSIGQLESLPQDGGCRDSYPPPLPTAEEKSDTSSVEIIAEQYRALLESRLSMLTDSHSEPPPSPTRGPSELSDVVEIRRSSSGELHAGKVASGGAGVANGSATSEDGTLVAFDDETVYFKPVSFSPEPRSPRAQQPEFPPPMYSPAVVVPDNLSLQICLDLLTRELSSAMTDRPQQPQRTGTEAAALQIWVMIEAYERLRDTLLDMQLPLGLPKRPLEMMFDMWLRCLYTIHDGLTGDASRTGSDDDYETLELETEALD